MSIFDALEHVPDAPTWRCPHCRTLQPESSRCRACQRSAVSCATCQRYRRSLVGDVGFCAHDPARSPLTGDEVRPCWVAEEVAPLPAGGLFEAVTSSLASDGPHGPRASQVDGIVAGMPISGGATPSGGLRSGSAEAAREVDLSAMLVDGARAEHAGGLLEAPHVAPLGSLEPGGRRRASRDRA